MKIGINNGRIYIETTDYDAFYMEVRPTQRFITTGEAVRLRKELDRAIAAASKPAAEADTVTPCRHPVETRYIDEYIVCNACGHCWPVS